MTTTIAILKAALPDDIVERVLAIGRVEWGTSHYQTDEQHVDDFRDTLRITREHFKREERVTAIHGLFLAGSNTILANTGNSPNSPQHARILTGVWNQLVDLAEQQARESAISSAEEKQGAAS